MKVVVIILSFNTKEFLKRCLNSLLRMNTKYSYDFYVVDNGSTDGSLEIVKKDFPKVHLIDSGKNLGFSAGNNLALKKVKADIYILLNSDTEVEKESLDQLVGFIKDSDYGICSCKLYFKDRSFQPNSGDLPLIIPTLVWLLGLDDILPLISSKLPSIHRKYAQYYQGERLVGWVSGSVMVIKKEVIDKIGFLDENIFMYGEDIEYCLRAQRRGFKVGWTNKAQIMHIGGGSSKSPSFRQWLGEFHGLLYIYNKYYGKLAAFILKLFIYFFTILRMAAFFLIGKPSISKTYAKIIINI